MMVCLFVCLFVCFGKMGCWLVGIKKWLGLFLAVPCGPGHLLYLLFQKDAASVPDRVVCIQNRDIN